MHLQSLGVDRLRNLKAVELELGGGLTVVTGRNGQGKTALLEAVHLLATGRSFRTQRPEDLVAWAGGPARVTGRVMRRAGTALLGVVVDGGVRLLLVDGREVGLEPFLGWIDLVALPNERMAVLRGGPDERRRFLDRGIVGLDPSYLRSLGEYRRTLAHRNALLKRAGARAEVEAWERGLVAAAARIHRRRREYALRLSAGTGEAGRALFPGGLDLVVRYQPSPAGAGEREAAEFEQVYAEALDRRRAADAALGFTAEGPHRDDLVVELEGADLRRFGSGGQVRLAVVALKLSKLRLLREEKGESSLFLMDDFDSDLDDTRATALAAYLHEGGFQALVATSKESLPARLGVPARRILVEAGAARPT